MDRLGIAPIVRLSTAAILSLILIAWMWYWGFDSMPDLPEPLMRVRDGWGGYPPVFLVTGTVSLLAVVIPIPVIRRGTWKQRCAAALVIALPLLIFVLLVWSVLDFTL